jgi:glycosyltransferase involved in cell wall biosynthesis
LGLRRVRSVISRYARESLLLLSGLKRSQGQPTVLVLPGETRADGAANLRGYLIADELRHLGWNAYTCHKNLTLAQRKRAIRLLRPDVLLMQMARHPLNRPTLYDVPAVFDIDDADYVDERRRADVISALENCAAVIAGSRAIADFCKKYSDRVEVVWTGAPVSSGRPQPQADRPLIVAWAALYPSRLAAEAQFIRDVLRATTKRTTDFHFLLYCDDGSVEYRRFADRFRAVGINVVTRPLIADYSRFLSSLDKVAVGLAPLVDIEGFSGGKSFGKVLAYMDRGVPVLTHPVADHPLFFESGKNGYMAQSAKGWAKVIADLLANPAERQRIADAARQDLSKRLTTYEAATRVDGVLRSVLERR